MWDKIIYAKDSVSDGKKLRYKMDCYILPSFISDHIIIHNHYYLLSLCKTQIKAKKVLMHLQY